MMRRSYAAFLLALAASAAQAQYGPTPIAEDGTVSVPAFKLPPSVYLSPEAKASLPRRPRDGGAFLDSIATGQQGDVGAMRARTSAGALSGAAEVSRKYGVTFEAVTIGGRPGVWTRPKARAPGRPKVLINLPGGGFVMATAGRGAVVEAAPLAGLTGIDIVSVEYRQAPEARFPAASEDVAAVYRTLLKTYRPQDIGIFGCSAGGLLTAQALAWFQKERLPTPGAAGIFCASADARWAGDAWYWFKPLQGLTAPPTLDERFYYGDHDLADPLMSPIDSDAVLKRFPPTLIVTATPAGEMSAAVNTHRLLIRAGVEADLHIWDGLNHGFYNDAGLPEAREAHEVMAKFFSRHLGHR
jgi:epsilon-lactone hydrolase